MTATELQMMCSHMGFLGLQQVVEGNQYFPPETIRKEHFQPSNTTTFCPWKGTAKYYNLSVDGKVGLIMYA